MDKLKRMFGSKYKVDTICENCNQKTVLFIPFGTYVYDFLGEKECRCNNCGCVMLKLMSDKLDPESLKKEHKRELMSLKEKLRQRREEDA